MGNFTNNAITDVGRMLLADVQAGAIFTPTRIVIGSGSMPAGATAQGMTDVITPVKSLAINKKRRTPDGKCVFGGVYNNEEVTEPFYFRELALYAKAVYLNVDGSVKSEGPETLYSYGNAGATADYMPAHSTSTVVEKQMDLVVWVGNDAQVDLSIESGIYVPHEEFDAHGARHAIDGDDPITPESIGAAPAGFGLGETSSWRGIATIEDLDNFKLNGKFDIQQTAGILTLEGVAFNLMGLEVTMTDEDHGEQVVLFTQGWKLRRVCDFGWQPWEWIIPPLNIGVEYRTIERRNGITVYKKLDTDGLLKYRLDGELVWKSYAQENGAAPAGYGLGGVTKMLRVADLNDILDNGWYSWTIDSKNIPFDTGSMLVITRGEGTGEQYSFQIAFYDGTYDTVIKIRKKTLGAWGEWKNWSPDAFAPAGFGLGGLSRFLDSTDDLNHAIQNGWYSWHESTPSNAPAAWGNMIVASQAGHYSQTVILFGYLGCSLQRTRVGEIWSEWEWINPPLNIGVEYRTTERYQGVAVYKKVDTAGNILWRSEYETSWHLLSSANYVMPATVE